MLIYTHYKLHLHFVTVCLVTQKNLQEFLKMYAGYLLDIGWAGYVDTLHCLNVLI